MAIAQGIARAAAERLRQPTPARERLVLFATTPAPAPPGATWWRAAESEALHLLEAGGSLVETNRRDAGALGAMGRALALLAGDELRRRTVTWPDIPMGEHRTAQGAFRDAEIGSQLRRAARTTAVGPAVMAAHGATIQCRQAVRRALDQIAPLLDLVRTQVADRRGLPLHDDPWTALREVHLAGIALLERAAALEARLAHEIERTAGQLPATQGGHPTSRLLEAILVALTDPVLYATSSAPECLGLPVSQALRLVQERDDDSHRRELRRALQRGREASRR